MRNSILPYQKRYFKKIKRIIKDTHIKDTHIKDTHIKDTQIKDTHIKDTHIKNTHIKDTHREKWISNDFEVWIWTFGWLVNWNKFLKKIKCSYWQNSVHCDRSILYFTFYLS